MSRQSTYLKFCVPTSFTSSCITTRPSGKGPTAPLAAARPSVPVTPSTTPSTILNRPLYSGAAPSIRHTGKVESPWLEAIR